MSVVTLLTLLFCLPVTLFCARSRLSGTPINKLLRWRAQFNQAFRINIVGFAAIALTFYFTYGWIADDVNYYAAASVYGDRPFLQLNGGTQFMGWLAHPFRVYLGFDLPAFHILWGSIGFIASVNFLVGYLRCVDLGDKKNRQRNRAAVLALLCFPNFLAWGRFFGKDSTMLFLASIFFLSASNTLFGKGRLYVNVLMMAISAYLMQIIRPHITGAMGLAFCLAMLFKSVSMERIQGGGIKGLAKIYVPALMITMAVLVVYSSIGKTTGGRTDVESAQRTIVNSAKMGAYGGSSTGLTDKFEEDQHVIFNPVQIGVNVFNLLFAPMPWSVRGARDLLAIGSNLLLVYLLWKYRRNINLKTSWKQYLFFNVVLLSGILSFLSGNVGLMLRQKTIILPFILLLIFAPDKNENQAPPSRNRLPKRRYNPGLKAQSAEQLPRI